MALKNRQYLSTPKDRDLASGTGENPVKTP